MSSALNTASTTDLLSWSYETYGDTLAFSTAFGPSGIVLMHLAAQIRPDLRVFFIDTGFHFAETLEMVDRVHDRFNVQIDVISSAMTIDEQNKKFGDELYAIDSDKCCEIRKLAPTRRLLEGKDAWMTARRRDQGKTRAQLNFLEPSSVSGQPIMKLNPLFKWTKAEIWQHIHTNQLPYNPLADQGYSSVGCAPCTQPTVNIDDERSGRWANQSKTECGLHTSL